MPHAFSLKSARLISLAVLLCSPLMPAYADDDIEGTIQSINAQAKSIVVNGDTIFAHSRTDYDDDLTRFEDLKVGDRVEVDYHVKNGRKFATEIELDD